MGQCVSKIYIYGFSCFRAPVEEFQENAIKLYQQLFAISFLHFKCINRILNQFHTFLQGNHDNLLKLNDSVIKRLRYYSEYSL